MKFGVIIPAAGRGKRMKKKVNKQFLNLGNYPVLVHTLKAFIKYPVKFQIVVVIREDEKKYVRNQILDKYNINNVKLVAGGESRRQSVYAGLKAFTSAIDYVIIHDGARPFITKRILNNVIKTVQQNKAVVTGVNVKDTIKVKDENSFVVKTLSRNKLTAIQTPQAFAYDLILKAHKEVSSETIVSDDASLVELINHPIKIIKGSDENIKLTTPVDLHFAELILESRSNYNESGNRL